MVGAIQEYLDAREEAVYRLSAIRLAVTERPKDIAAGEKQNKIDEQKTDDAVIAAEKEANEAKAKLAAAKKKRKVQNCI